MKRFDFLRAFAEYQESQVQHVIKDHGGSTDLCPSEVNFLSTLTRGGYEVERRTLVEKLKELREQGLLDDQQIADVTEIFITSVIHRSIGEVGWLIGMINGVEDRVNQLDLVDFFKPHSRPTNYGS